MGTRQEILLFPEGMRHDTVLPGLAVWKSDNFVRGKHRIEERLRTLSKEHSKEMVLHFSDFLGSVFPKIELLRMNATVFSRKYLRGFEHFLQ